MDTGTLSVKDLFGRDRRYVVPLFQRPYVWNEVDQWQPFWEDVSQLGEATLEGRIPPTHFMGAIVLDQILNPSGHLERRLVIDGQQRLTTVQLLLEAFADICTKRGIAPYDRALRKLTRNDDPISNDPDEEFKVWPTNADQAHFRDVMKARGPQEVLGLYGKTSQAKWAGHPIADAYLYFYRVVAEWLGNGCDLEPGVAALYNALRTQVRVVAIDLTREDDAQVIFETLNARGTPLLPSDLVKNFLFHRLTDEKADIESLYETYWKPFDDDTAYWRKESGRGHARRPTIDTFLQHYLTSQTGEEIQVSHLFTTYRAYATARDGTEAELEDLRRLADKYRSFDEHPSSTPLGLFFSRLKEMNVTSAYPFFLKLFDVYGNDPSTILETLDLVESFLVRRLVTRLTTRGYNRLFIELTQALQGDQGTPTHRVRAYLTGSSADFRRWPDDGEFRSAWHSNSMYTTLVRSRVRMILEALEARMRTPKSESLQFKDSLTIEHLLPTDWREHYPMPPGASSDEVAARDVLKHTVGNLTLLTGGLNPSISNGPWCRKREEILKFSALALNRDLGQESQWNEERIKARADRLFEIAKTVWPSPPSNAGN